MYIETPQPLKEPCPGDHALVAFVLKLYGFKEEDPFMEFQCNTYAHQKIEVVSTPRVQTYPVSNAAVSVIDIRLPDTDGIDRTLTVPLYLLLFAANTNKPIRT